MTYAEREIFFPQSKLQSSNEWKSSGYFHRMRRREAYADILAVLLLSCIYCPSRPYYRKQLEYSTQLSSWHGMTCLYMILKHQPRNTTLWRSKLSDWVLLDKNWRRNLLSTSGVDHVLVSNQSLMTPYRSTANRAIMPAWRRDLRICYISCKITTPGEVFIFL